MEEHTLLSKGMLMKQECVLECQAALDALMQGIELILMRNLHSRLKRLKTKKTFDLISF
jgi:hypothetical protein